MLDDADLVKYDSSRHIADTHQGHDVDIYILSAVYSFDGIPQVEREAIHKCGNSPI